MLFQLTPPIQRATQDFLSCFSFLKISTHAPYTEGDVMAQLSAKVLAISTHAPYTEGDWYQFQFGIVLNISTHAPYTEGDIAINLFYFTIQYFNSRPLYRGRPENSLIVIRQFPYFNSRPLYRGRPLLFRLAFFQFHFNSRPLYRGRLYNFNKLKK